jgi:hypothetical protein
VMRQAPEFGVATMDPNPARVFGIAVGPIVAPRRDVEGRARGFVAVPVPALSGGGLFHLKARAVVMDEVAGDQSPAFQRQPGGRARVTIAST